MLLTITASLVALMGFAGLVLDIGYMQYYRRRLQIAADAGSIGGVRELQFTGAANVASAVAQEVTTNGFTNGVAGATVTILHPPTSGRYTGNTRYVEVIVARQQPALFMKMLRVDSTTIRARSVGGMTTGAYCIMALDPLLPGALNVAGSATVNVPTCGVMVDSSNPAAMTVGNAACITANQIDIVGSYTSGGCAPTPAPATGSDFVYDPLSTLAAPSFSGACDYTNYTVNANATLSPGTYCGGIRVVGAGKTVTFNAGTYILNGGGLFASGGNTLQGSGITFYNTATGSQVYGDIRLVGGVRVNLSAPTSGPMEGILFFQDRSILTTSVLGNVISGDASSTIDGMLYFPNGTMTYTGNSSAYGYTNMIAKTITFSGNSTVRSDYSSLSSGAPIKTGALAE